MGIATTLVFAGFAHAQLNEAKVERDASGIFKGKMGNAMITFFQDGNPPMAHPTPTEVYTGKIKVPVKDGKLSTNLNDDDLEGPSSAGLRGKEQRSKVTRGGKKIACKASGIIDPSVAEDPNWSNCGIKGDLTDKGSKWVAKAEGDATRTYPDQVDEMTMEVYPGFTVIYTDLKVSGAD